MLLEDAMRAAELAASKKPPSKFKSLLQPSSSPDQSVPAVVGAVPSGASILIIQHPWISLILDGKKTWEIRGKPCNKARGDKVYLALSGAGGAILGSATFVACHGPLTSSQYGDASQRHRVAGAALPYGASTYAWELKLPRRFKEPVRYHHKPGAVVWAKM